MYYAPFITMGILLRFGLLWCSVLSLLSFAGGWRRLSLKYPAPENPPAAGKEYRFQSVRLRLVNYSLCMTVITTDTGVMLKVMKLFSFMHRPMFIPYPEMKEPSFGRFVTDYVVFRADSVRVEIYGSSAEEIRVCMGESPVS